MALTCPHCENSIGMQECVEPSVIRAAEGDVAVCFECGEPALYMINPGRGLVLRSPTTQEYAAIHARPEMHAIRSAFQVEPDSPWAAADFARWQLTTGRHG